jgi:hypothetical protein
VPARRTPEPDAEASGEDFDKAGAEKIAKPLEQRNDGNNAAIV